MTNEVHANSNVPKLAPTRVEAAQALGVRPITVDRLAKRGLLHPSRATRRPLYSVKEIERFLQETSDPHVLGVNAVERGHSADQGCGRATSGDKKRLFAAHPPAEPGGGRDGLKINSVLKLKKERRR